MVEALLRSPGLAPLVAAALHCTYKRLLNEQCSWWIIASSAGQCVGLYNQQFRQHCPHQTFNFCLATKIFCNCDFLKCWTGHMLWPISHAHVIVCIYGAPEALVVHLIFWNWRLTLMIRSLLWSIFSWEGQTNPHMDDLILVMQHLVVPVAASISWPLSLPAARLIDQKKRKLNRWGSNLRSSQMFPSLQNTFFLIVSIISVAQNSYQCPILTWQMAFSGKESKTVNFFVEFKSGSSMQMLTLRQSSSSCCCCTTGAAPISWNLLTSDVLYYNVL